MIKIILVSVIASGIVSFLMMKFQMKMIDKWMDKFFDEETERMKKFLSKNSYHQYYGKKEMKNGEN